MLWYSAIGILIRTRGLEISFYSKISNFPLCVYEIYFYLAITNFLSPGHDNLSQFSN